MAFPWRRSLKVKKETKMSAASRNRNRPSTAVVRRRKGFGWLRPETDPEVQNWKDIVSVQTFFFKIDVRVETQYHYTPSTTPFLNLFHCTPCQTLISLDNGGGVRVVAVLAFRTKLYGLQLRNHH